MLPVGRRCAEGSADVSGIAGAACRGNASSESPRESHVSLFLSSFDSHLLASPHALVSPDCLQLYMSVYGYVQCFPVQRPPHISQIARHNMMMRHFRLRYLVESLLHGTSPRRSPSMSLNPSLREQIACRSVMFVSHLNGHVVISWVERVSPHTPIPLAFNIPSCIVTSL